MTKSKAVDQNPESESNRRQKAQKAQRDKDIAEIAEKLFADVIRSVHENSKDSAWDLCVQAAGRVDELSLVENAGPLKTLPIGDAARYDIVTGFGLTPQDDESLKVQPWPPVPLEVVELPSAAQEMINITNKYLRLSPRNEAAARCIINTILFAMLDKVAPCPDYGTWPLNLQTETPLISRPFTLNGKVHQAKGTCDYTLWYGDKGGPDKAINLVLVEAKGLGLASSGDDQALGYMACVHQERRSCPSRNSTVYGLSTDGEEFRFLRINQKGEFAKVIMAKTPGGSYSSITSMLAFIMREAVSQSPYTSKNSSKDVSMEDDPFNLPCS
ncbi:unnamed protein product [Penicillium viridicatum]